MIAAAFRCVAGAVLLFAMALGSASAQDRGSERRNQPGKFDFYVLSLSWSPSFCRDSEERGRNGGIQCSGRPYSFVVHGLWPQYERGFPRDCQVPAPRLNRNIMTSMLDLMPAPGLIFHEWDNHGTCSGLGAQAYFDLVRKARAAVKIPDVYTSPNKTLVVAPDEVEQAFIQANPGLTRDAIAVTCGSTRLSEVRICMGKDLRFRDCAEVNHNACRRNKLNMPPVRGG
ncbi:MAG: ribonuclease T2 [Rhizobiales bacterium]|jgi:ribonuclease T2|nr:ribonuclease T2 [Hyphomicrobiales bacterium]